MGTLISRMLRAAKLESHLYEEVEHDPNATGQAALVVVIVSILLGIVGALIGWAVLALLIYLIGAKLLPEAQTRANWGQLARCLGFAYSPGVLLVFAVIPLLGVLVAVVVFVWLLIAWVVAIRQALDYTSTLRAVGVGVLGWLAYVAINVVLGFVLAPLTAVAG